jgi:Caspase domain
MTIRALVVAIEKYPNASGLADKLPETNNAARSFCKWLTEFKGIHPKGSPGYDPRTFFCCAGADVEFRTHGTTRPQIIRALKDLEKVAKEDLANGKAATDELYCFFSGHGICYPRNASVQEDLFLASDFTKMEDSGGACVKIPELIDLLRPALGPGDQYYFFDACRTEVKFGAIEPSGLGMIFKRVQAEFPGQAVLFSVAQGLAARTKSEFAKHLVDGLGGKGRAKGWYREELYVKFDFLREYLNLATKQAVAGDAGSGKGLILKIKPVRKVPCTINVQGAAPSDRFTFKVTRRDTLECEDTFVGTKHTLKVKEPGDYQVEVTHPEARVERVKPPASELVDLYDPAEVIFRKLPAGLESTSIPLSDDGLLNVRGAPNASIRLRNAQSIDDKPVVVARGMMSESLSPGNYIVEIDEAGQVVAQQSVNVRAGKTVEADPLARRSSALRNDLLGFFPRDGHAVDFSESLGGAIADPDLGLWLSLLGASRVAGRDGGLQFSKLGQVPLKASFENVRAGRAALYVLSGFEGRRSPCAIGIGKRPHWTKMSPVSHVSGLYEFSVELEPGPQLVTFQSKGSPPITLSTHTIANRATLLALSSGGGLAPIKLYQFVLTIQALVNQLPEARKVTELIPPLPATRFLVQAERLFAADRSMSKLMRPDKSKGEVDAETREHYDKLIEMKWLDPIGSLIVANDLLRRGVMSERSKLAKYRSILRKMVEKLRASFGAMPDVEALARAIGANTTRLTAPPLLADSLTAFDLKEQKAFMPYANDRRRFGTPWVTWVGAVKPFYR